MNNTLEIDGEYPGSQSAVLAPIMQAVFADIQSRQVKMGSFDPKMTQYPPPATDPGLAYFLALYDRLAHMKFNIYSPDAKVEVLFGTGGYQYGPKRVLGRMVAPSQWTDLLSLMAVTWITLKLNQLMLVPWSLKAIKGYYPQTVANPLYTNYLRTFCFNVLGMPEDSFTSIINQTGYIPDVVDE
jgi:hypothetical protein